MNISPGLTISVTFAAIFAAYAAIAVIGIASEWLIAKMIGILFGTTGSIIVAMFVAAVVFQFVRNHRARLA